MIRSADRRTRGSRCPRPGEARLVTPGVARQEREMEHDEQSPGSNLDRATICVGSVLTAV
jgi:hypothetical protein